MCIETNAREACCIAICAVRRASAAVMGRAMSCSRPRRSYSAPAVRDLIVRMLKPWKQMSHTLTCDNGKEFAGHRAIAQRLQIDCYFADPYASWQRGTNEQTNGLIRQYVPKSTDLDTVSGYDINRIMDRLNHRPRKTLDWKTPFEVMMQAYFTGVALGS